jgi:glutamine amidotransferase
MCRLFGLSCAPHRIVATFWLLEAPDSLAEQSRRNPDGTGLGTFTADGDPVVEKQPVAAYQDTDFATEAKQRRSATFLAHVRHASTGGRTVANTHPFVQHGRIFAHNGVVGDLAELDERLGEHRALVGGDTDSERLFALITKEIDAHHGDVTAGITAAIRWVAAHLSLYSVNLILTTADQLWALRYPAGNDLLVLARGAGAGVGRHLEHASPTGTVRVRSTALTERAAVVVASERMDDNPGWRSLRPGELLHVAPGQRISSRMILDGPPARPLRLADLGAAAASQTVS